MTGNLTDVDCNELGKRAARLGVLLKARDRVAHVCAEVAKHDREKIRPAGFAAQVVTPDREACVLDERELDRHLPPGANNGGDDGAEV